MKVLSVKCIGTESPESGSGTGYDQPSTFEFILGNTDTGETYTMNIPISIWYKGCKKIKEEFFRKFEFETNISNLATAYGMFIDEIVNNGLCPYTKKALL